MSTLFGLKVKIALAVEPLAERLSVIRLGKAEHDGIVVTAAQVIRPRGAAQVLRESVHHLGVWAAHLVGRECNVVRPIATQLGFG
jgi:hypothetical protein